MDYNNLIVNVVKVKGLQLKTNKQLDVFVNASVTGKGSWKGKVCTDAVRTTTGDCEWNQLLEFALLGMDSQLQIQVQYKTVFGTTETLGQLQLVLSELLRYNMLTWFDLKKRTNDEKDRGQLLVAFNFSNKINSSISQFSLNKIDKEKKLDKLKRKMHLVRRKDKFGDSKSLASVSISRRSSMSSTASALAFPSPTPPDDEHMHNSSLNVSDSHGDVMNASSDQLAPSPQFLTPPTNHITMRPSPTSFGERVKVRAEQIVQPLMSAARHRKSDSLDKHGHKHGENELSAHDSNDSGKISRPLSIASSSGFGSLASANVQNNEPQNPEYLLTIIAHQRREMAAKDNRIRDLEKYVDSLLLRVMEKNPELLQAPTPLGFY